MSKKRRRHERLAQSGLVAQFPSVSAAVHEEATTRDQMALGLDTDPVAATAVPEAPSIESSVTGKPAATDRLQASDHDADALLVADDLFPTPIGMRLRAAREARGLTRVEVARASRLSSAVLADIESDALDRLGAPIYVRGYLKSYARAVGVPEAVVDIALEKLARSTPTLQAATPPVSRSRYLATRYANLGAYALLTLVVLVPVVMSLRSGARPIVATPTLNALDSSFGDSAAQSPTSTTVITSPDSDVIMSTASDEQSGPPGPEPTEVDATDHRATEQVQPSRPVMASMAPMPADASTVAAIARADSQRVVLRLTQSSWVEFTGVQGQRIEYALLPAGAVREYQVAGHADLRIGNTRGAALEVDGHTVDLGPYTRANVARITLGVESSPQ